MTCSTHLFHSADKGIPGFQTGEMHQQFILLCIMTRTDLAKSDIFIRAYRSFSVSFVACGWLLGMVYRFDVLRRPSCNGCKADAHSFGRVLRLSDGPPHAPQVCDCGIAACWRPTVPTVHSRCVRQGRESAAGLDCS